jgi:hypothetical protein
MLTRFAGAVAAVVLLAIGFAPQRIDAQATQKPAPCAAEARAFRQAGNEAADLNELREEAGKATRAEVLNRLKTQLVSTAKTEKERAWSVFRTCVYQLRLAQFGPMPAPVTIVSTQPARTTTGNIAGSLVYNWAAATLERAAEGSQPTPSLDAIAALEAGPADGSRLLLIPIPMPTDRNARQIVEALVQLRRIRMLAGPARDTPLNSGIALFAPSATPPARVTQLIAQAAEATSEFLFTDFVRYAEVPPPNGDVADTLLSVLSVLNRITAATPPAAVPSPAPRPVAPAPAPPRVATPPNTRNTAVSNLRPTDVFIEDQRGLTYTILVGKTLADAIATQIKYGRRDAPEAVGTISSCSAMLRRLAPPRQLGVGWWAWVSAYFHPTLRTPDQHQWGFACGGTTPEEALAAAYGKLKESRNQTFTSAYIALGITAEPDHARLHAERRLGQPYSAWQTECGVSRDPGDGQAFAAMVMSPQMRMHPKAPAIGCHPFYNTPTPNQPPPDLRPR